MKEKQREIHAILNSNGEVTLLVQNKEIRLRTAEGTRNAVTLSELQITSLGKTTAETLAEVAALNLRATTEVTGQWVCTDMPTGLINAEIDFVVPEAGRFVVYPKLHSVDVSPYEWVCAYDVANPTTLAQDWTACVYASGSDAGLTTETITEEFDSIFYPSEP